MNMSCGVLCALRWLIVFNYWRRRGSGMAFKRILCAVDFSETSLEAFRRAAEIARRFASSLYVLHVIEARPVAPYLIRVDEVGEMAVNLEEKATAALESLVESSASDLEGVPLTLEVTAGRAFVEILDHARDWAVDLLVLDANRQIYPADRLKKPTQS